MSRRNISETSKSDYEKALKDRGYNSVNLNYRKYSQTSERNKNRNIIWFNLTLNKNDVTYIAKLFLNLVDKYFPK